MKQLFGAAFTALCLASCFRGGAEESAEVIESASPEQEVALVDTEDSSIATTSPQPVEIDSSFDTELRVGGGLLDLPQEKQFQPSSPVNSEDDDPTVITRPPSE